MFGKVIAYGFAFGSAAAASLYIHYANELHLKRDLASGVSLIASILIVGLAIFLYIHSVFRSSNTVNVGKGLLGSLLVGTIISLCTIFAYGIVLQKGNPAYNKLISINKTLIEKAIISNNKPSAEQQKEVETKYNYYLKNITQSSFAKITLQMNLSLTFVVSLISILYYTRNNRG